MFKNPFSFQGRIRRLEYGLSNLMYLAGIFLVSGLCMLFLDPIAAGTNIILMVLWIPFAWFMLAQGAKRCHDRGNSGWWQIIPFYGFWMLFSDGEIGSNEYGENPKGLEYQLLGQDLDFNSTASPIDNVDGDGVIKSEK